LGFRLSTEKSTAVIIADEVRKRAALQFINPGELLGLVMAHEIGHLLLRSKAHSTEGIMQGELSTNLGHRRRRLLVFTRKQAAAMQDEVRRRMGVANGWKALNAMRTLQTRHLLERVRTVGFRKRRILQAG
jgi:hypothetical protein